MLELYRAGTLKYAGPFCDTGGGAAVVEVHTADEAMHIIARDPAVQSGVMVGEAHSWSLVDWRSHLAIGTG